MPLKHLNLSVFRLLLGFTHLKFAETGRRRIRPRTRPGHEVLERRLALDGSITTYDWVARGDGVSWSDPNNWIHIGPIPSVGVPGVPVGGSNVEFPPLYTLPAGSPSTINFNSPYSSFPINLLTIEDSFTFSGNPITVNNGVIVANPPGKLADATILLSGVTLGSRSTIYTQQGSTLNLADSADPTGLKLGLEGGVTKGGGGQLFIDTQSVIAPYLGFNLQPFEIAGGTVTMGTSVTFTGSRFQVDSNAALDIAAAASVRIAALAGSGTVDIQGTGSANDTTSLKISEPAAQSDKFTGLIDGVGQLILQGNGTLTTGAIDFSDGGGIQVLLGTLVADGAVSVGTLSVSNGATFGGVGPWHFSGSAVFQAGTNYALTLDGLTPGTQYTQLVNGDSTAGINLGNSKLTATIGYQYQAGDQFTIATGPLVQGVFQNVQGGTVLLGNNVPFSVSYSSTAVTLTAAPVRDDDRIDRLPKPQQSRPAGHVHRDREHAHAAGYDRLCQLHAGRDRSGDRRRDRPGPGLVYDLLPAPGDHGDHGGLQRVERHPRLDQPDGDAIGRPLYDVDIRLDLRESQPDRSAVDVHRRGHHRRRDAGHDRDDRIYPGQQAAGDRRGRARWNREPEPLVAPDRPEPHPGGLRWYARLSAVGQSVPGPVGKPTRYGHDLDLHNPDPAERPGGDRARGERRRGGDRRNHSDRDRRFPPQWEGHR